MPHWVAALLGVVEGLTEYLPVSSTGHLLLVSRALQLKGEAVDSFDIVIQLGAILAVLVQYRTLLSERVAGLFRKEAASISLFTALLLGFIPAAAVGFLFRKSIKAALFGPWPIAAALIVGGVVMIAWDRFVPPNKGLDGLEHVTPRRALMIGFGQCFSLWPGSSRSMCTILAARAAGLSTATAAEFSFLLGLPTLGAATVYEGLKAGPALLSEIGLVNIGIGLVVSFLVAWAVIAGFIAYLKTRGLAPFGVYRIVLGLIVIWTMLQ